MMDKLRSLFPEEIIEAFGWTLFHSLWQITVVAIVLVLVLVSFKTFSAKIRYIIAFLALVSCLVWSTTTWYSAYNYAVKKKEMTETMLSNPEAIKALLKEQIEKNVQTSTSSSTSVKLNRLKLKSSVQRFMPLVFYIWLAGVLFFLLKMTGGMIYILQLRNKHNLEIEKKWLEKANTYIRKLQINRKLEILQSSIAKVPMVLGYFKPIVLLPASLLSGLSTKEIEAIIAHELAHIKRNDYLFNIIQSIIETLFFYHPAVWMISKTIRNERENSCDDLALKITRDKLSYIKALAASENLFASSSNRAVAFASKGGLLNRVKRIQNHTFMKNNGYEGFIATSLVFISIILLSFTFDRSNPKDDDYFNERNNYEQPFPADTAKQKKKHKIKVIKTEKSENDSLEIIVKTLNEELNDIPEEMQQLIEIAYTTDDDSLVKIIHHSFDIALHELDDSLYKIDVDMTNFDIAMKDFDVNMEDFDAIMKDFDSTMRNFKFIMKDKDNKVIMYQIYDNGDTLKHDVNVKIVMENAMKEHEKAMKEHEKTIIFRQKEMKEAQKALEIIDMDSLIAAAKKDAEFHKKTDEYEIIIKNAEELKELQKEEIEKIVEEAMKTAEEAEKSYGRKKVIIHKEIEDEEVNSLNKESEIEMEEQLKNLEGE